MTSTIQDYAGRLFDVAVLRPGPLASTEAGDVSQLSMGADYGAACAGVQKLVQNWLILFLTQKGSNRFFPERGSSFPGAMVSGRIQTNLDLTTVFAMAADEVAEQLAAENQNTAFTDEQYASVELISAVIESYQKIKLRVRINSVAGVSRTVLFPIEAIR